MKNKFRIFRQDNYLEIRPVNSTNVFTGHVKSVRVFRDNTGKNKFRFFGVKNWSPTVFLDLTQIVDQNGDSYTLSSWEDFYNTNTGNFSAGGGSTPFDPSLYDLEEFQNGSGNLFIRQSDLVDYLQLETVDTYSDLPDPTTASNELYVVENAQGTNWLPGSLGGTYYPEGMYYSNGVKWIYQKSAYQATQMEVNAGLNTDKFVTPNTLEGIKPITQGGDTVDNVRKLSAMTKSDYSLITPDSKTIYFLEDTQFGWQRYVDTVNTQNLAGGASNVFDITGSMTSNGGTTLIDSAANKIQPNILNDYIQIDLSFTVETPSGTNNYIEVSFVVNGITYRASTQLLVKGTGTEDTISFSFGLPVESDFLTNGGQFILKPNTSIVIKNKYISVIEIYKGL